MAGIMPRLDALSALHPSVLTKPVVRGVGDGLTIRLKTTKRNADYTSPLKKKAPESHNPQSLHLSSPPGTDPGLEINISLFHLDK